MLSSELFFYVIVYVGGEFQGVWLYEKVNVYMYFSVICVFISDCNLSILCRFIYIFFLLLNSGWVLHSLQFICWILLVCEMLNFKIK